MPTLVESSLVETFQRDGFVVVPDLLSADECEHFEAAVTAGVRARTAGDDRPLHTRSRYQQSFLQCMNLWEDRDDVRPLTFHPRLAQVAAELLQVDAVRLWSDQALYKQPGGRGTDAHQDLPFWPIKETESITAWVALQGETRKSGAMAYLPGSHLVGRRKFVNIFVGEPYDLLNDPAMRSIEPVFVDVPKGTVVYHHSLTVHFTEANTTDRERRVHTIMYFADGSTRGYPSDHFAVERAHIPVGAVIDSDVTPVAWPRPLGDLPPVPTTPIVVPGDFTNPGAIPRKD